MEQLKLRHLLPLFLVLVAIASMTSVDAIPPFDPPEVRAEVSRVFDGETIRVLTTTGVVENVRYIGIDAPGPTPSDCFGPEATLYNRDLTLNRSVWLEFDELERDDAGNLMAYVYLDSEGQSMVNAIMLSQGLARTIDPSEASPNLRYSGLFGQLQSAAEAEAIGLWNACPAVPLPANIAPTAEFTFEPAEPEPGQLVTFDASASVDLDGTISNYNWNFGDGTSSTGISTTHTFAAAGVFAVTLSITDDRGSVDTFARNIAVGDTELPPPTPDPDPPQVTTNQEAVIELIRYDADGEDNENKNGEYIDILASNQNVDLTGWTIADELGDRGVASHVYRFPEDFILAANSRLRLFSGCGIDAGNQLYWCATTQIWDNGEDTAILRNAEEDEVDRCRYGDPDGAERGKAEYNCITLEFGTP